jgi:hypothetical protein
LGKVLTNYLTVGTPLQQERKLFDVVSLNGVGISYDSDFRLLGLAPEYLQT